VYKRESISVYNIFTDVENPRQHLINIFYSAFYFALTFILLNYFGYLVLALNAKILDYQPVFSYNGIENLTNTYGWSTKRIAFVYLSSPIVGFLISFFAYYWYIGTDHHKPHLQQFFFWLSINGFVMFYSYLITGLFAVGNYSSKFFTGFVSFFSWLNWDDSMIFFALLVSAIGLLFYSLRFGRPVLKSSYSKNLLKKRNGRKLVFVNVVLLPFGIGCIFLLASIFPMDLIYTLVRLACYPLVFLIIYWRITNRRKKVGRILKGGLSYRSPVVLLLLLAILIAISRTLLAHRFWL